MELKTFAALFLTVILVANVLAKQDEMTSMEEEREDKFADSNDKSAARIKRGLCNLVCSCGWGNCYPAPGYTDSTCCSSGYRWTCCR
uniref:Uncharacterized protein n=1 Tax=Acrobeloides nanus TaxID=290746 RepID=A0A914CHB0_9BILA